MVGARTFVKLTVLASLGLLLACGSAPGCGPKATPVPSDDLSYQYEYDPKDNLTSLTTPGGDTIRYAYDALDRLIGVGYPDGGEVTYTYDKRGFRTEMHDSIGITRYQYDDLGRLIEATDANGNTLNYGYDRLGKIASLTYPGGESVAYQYNAQGALSMLTDSSGSTPYRYNELGQLVGRTLPNAVATSYAYDAAGRLSNISHLGPSGNLLLGFAYTFDPVGNLLRKVRTTSDGGELTTTYGYDEGDRLTRISYPDGREVEYRYDPGGNRLEEITPEGTTSYIYDARGRLLSAGETKFGYDAVGNRVEKREGDEVTSYRYDYENRLVEVNEGQNTVEFNYDGDGNLLRKTVNGASSRFIYDLSGLLPELAAQEDQGDQLIRFPYGWERLGELDTSQGNRFYLTDGTDTVVGLLDDRGELIASYSFDPFGAPLEPVSPTTRAPSLRPHLGLASIGQGLVSAGKVSESAQITPPPTPPIVFPAIRRVYGMHYNPALHLLSRAYNPPYNPALHLLVRPHSPTYNPLLVPLANSYARSVKFVVDPQIGRAIQQTASTLPPIIGEFVSGVVTGISTGELPGFALGKIPKQFVTAGTTSTVGGITTIYMRQGFLNSATRGILRFASRLGPIPLAFNILIGSVEAGMALREGDFLVAAVRLGTPVLAGGVSYLIFVGIVGTGAVLSVPAGVAVGAATLAVGSAVGVSMLGRWIGNRLEYAPYTPAQSDISRVFAGEVIDIGNRRLVSPFPPGGGGGPAGTGVGVGGVSLDKVAEVLVNLNEITGAAFDQNSGQLILMGKRDSSLPPMNLDDLVVAIRCIYGAEDPGVSIDPVDPSSQDGRMVTTYICPHVENTHFGLVMAEADLYLKSASIGKDNETGEPLTSNVACYRSELDWMLESERQGSDPRWHRMWFLPREIKVVPSPDGNSMRFDRTTIEVQARFVEFDAAGQKHDVPGSDPAIDAFVRCLTDQYDEFTLEREELQELKQLAQIVGVVKWLRDNNIPVDLAWVERYEVTRVSTPTAVKGIHVTAERPVPGGTRILSLYGGVDFSEENTYAAPSDNVHALAQTAVSARPNAAVLTWNFDHDGNNLTAVALNLSKSKIVGGYSDRQTDISLPIRGNQDVNFTRFYNSLDIVDGPLGLGWSPFPFELNIQQVPRKAGPERFLIESEVSLFDAGRQGVEKFEGPFKESNTGRILYLPKCTACGYIDLTEQPGGDYVLRLQDRSLVLFSPTGQLRAFADENGNRVDYRFREGLLVEIGVLDGPTLRLDYNGQGRIIQINASDERKVKYDYDTVGRLISVTQANGNTTTYEYDSKHHLTKVADTSQRNLITNTYDGLGRLLEQTGRQGYAVVVDYDQAGRQAVYSDNRGHRLIRTYDEQQRLAKETDSLGETVTFTYDTSGRVTSVTDKLGQPTFYEYDQVGNVTQITGPLNTILQFGYDANRNLIYFIDEKQEVTLYEYGDRNNLTRITNGLKVTEWDSGRPRQFEASQAQSREFRYNPDGTVAVVTGPSGQETEFGYDADGNVVSIRAGQVEVRQEFDTHSRLTKVFYGQGQSTGLEYDNRDLLTGISTADGNIRYEYDSAGNLVEATDVNGHATSYAYDDSNNLVRLIEATGAEIRYKYDPDGNLIEVIDANDRRTTFEYDLLGRVTRQSIAISEITPNP